MIMGWGAGAGADVERDPGRVTLGGLARYTAQDGPACFEPSSSGYNE